MSAGSETILTFGVEVTEQEATDIMESISHCMGNKLQDSPEQGARWLKLLQEFNRLFVIARNIKEDAT